MSGDGSQPPPDTPGGAGQNEPPRRARYYIPNCRTLRVHKGKTIAELAKAANVNRSTIDNIESLVGVTEVYARRVFNVLKGWWPEPDLQADVEITTTNRKIASPFPISIQRSSSDG